MHPALKATLFKGVGGYLANDFMLSRFRLPGGQYANFLDIPGATVTRATTGLAANLAGVLASFAAGVPRITDAGLTVEPASSNTVLRSRDLTNAAWSLTSNMSRVQNQTGADGTPNAATLLTATGAGGYVVQPVGAAFSARYQTAYVKRISGSGVVTMTMDGGVTTTAIVPTGSWQRFSMPTQTLANPQVGFAIVTSGDAIAVDFVQNEPATYATTPIPTTTVPVTRNADVVAQAVSLPVGQPFTASAKIIEPTAGALAAAVCTVFMLDDGNSGASFPNRLRVYVGSGPDAWVVGASAGVGFSDGLSIVQTPGQPLGVALSVVANQLVWSVNGLPVRTYALPGGAFTAPLTRLTEGANQFGVLQLNSVLRSLTIVKQASSPAALQALSAA